MSEIIWAFDHLFTPLTLVGFKVKVSKCKFWSSLGIFQSIKIPQGLHFGHKWFTHFWCAGRFSRLCHAFFG
jgi:hypothetical protein